MGIVAAVLIVIAYVEREAILRWMEENPTTTAVTLATVAYCLTPSSEELRQYKKK